MWSLTQFSLVVDDIQESYWFESWPCLLQVFWSLWFAPGLSQLLCIFWVGDLVRHKSWGSCLSPSACAPHTSYLCDCTGQAAEPECWQLLRISSTLSAAPLHSQVPALSPPAPRVECVLCWESRGSCQQLSILRKERGLVAPAPPDGTYIPYPEGGPETSAAVCISPGLVILWRLVGNCCL